MDAPVQAGRMGRSHVPTQHWLLMATVILRNLFICPTTIFFFFLVVLGLELRANTLSHSTSPFLCWVF
jgi:hypothetical protein